MPSSSDSSLSPPPDPFIIESSSHFISPPEPVFHCNREVEDSLKPYITVFRLDPFTSHDGIHGRPIPASIRAWPHHQDTSPMTLEFQLDLQSPSQPASGPEPDSDSGSISGFSLPGSDVAEPAQLRYLDGDTAPPLQSPRRHSEVMNPTPMYHTHPPSPRRSFSRFDSTCYSHATPHDRYRSDDYDHPFTRTNRTPDPELDSLQQPTRIMYPRSLAYFAERTEPRPESMYAPESTFCPSDGYQNTYSSSDTSGSDGYPAICAPAVGSHSFSRDDSYRDRGAPHSQQAFTPPFAKNDTPPDPQYALFSTPAQMATASCQDGVNPSGDSNQSSGPTLCANSNIGPTDGYPLGYDASGPLQHHFPTDGRGIDGSQLRAGDRRDFSLAHDDARLRDTKFQVSSPHQAQPEPTRHIPLSTSYDSYSRDAYLRSAPRDYDRVVSSGYEQNVYGCEPSEDRGSNQQVSGAYTCVSPFGSRSPASSVFDRRASLSFDRSIVRTGVLDHTTPGALGHSEADTMGLVDPDSFHRPISRSCDRSDPLSAFGPLGRDVSFGALGASGTVTPMRIFDSPIMTRSLTLSPTPSTTSGSVERHTNSRSSRRFAPFMPGEMSQAGGGSNKHQCDICHRRFNRPSTLVTHMNSHTGERPHLCPILNCGARFSVPSNLKRHVKGHKSIGSQPRGRKRRSAVRKEVSPKPHHHALQERKNAQPPCPESLRGMHNLSDLSSRPPFKMPEGVAIVPLPTPLPAVRPRGHPGDENYEERDSFFYARETDQPTPYHPLMWKLRRVLPGPLPSQAELEARTRGEYGFGDSLSGLREWGDDHHRA